MRSLAAILTLSLLVATVPGCASALTYPPEAKASDFHNPVGISFILVSAVLTSAGILFAIAPTPDVRIVSDISTLNQEERDDLATSLTGLGGNLEVTFAENTLTVGIGN